MVALLTQHGHEVGRLEGHAMPGWVVAQGQSMQRCRQAGAGLNFIALA